MTTSEATIHRRAIEAINWAMPAVNLDLMLQAMIGSAKGQPNQIAYWSRLTDWKIQTLTPNPDVIYLKPFFNTKDVGPMVLEIPPAEGGSITGTIMDAWQSALEDVGPAGVDKGKGGIPYDVRFFQSLDRVVQIEPWLARDRVMIDVLKSIGIEKGKPFNPDAKTRDILNAAAREAKAWLEARYELGFPSFYEGRQWAMPAVPELAQTMATFYEKPDAYSVDGRGLADYYAYSTHQAPGRRPVLPDGHEGQRGPCARWRPQLSAQRAGQRAGETGLVGDGLRSRHARPHSRRPSSQPFLTVAGTAEESRRFRGRLLRAEGAGRPGAELGADEGRRSIRGAVPDLRS